MGNARRTPVPGPINFTYAVINFFDNVTGKASRPPSPVYASTMAFARPWQCRHRVGMVYGVRRCARTVVRYGVAWRGRQLSRRPGSLARRSGVHGLQVARWPAVSRAIARQLWPWSTVDGRAGCRSIAPVDCGNAA